KYIRYYNNDRIKLRLKGQSPVKYRALLESKVAS
ncbi:MAG: IS3 family transposase, partial [Bacteroidales bacterium]|nr:IS3 family transposase [Bacteroidales bacterium]MBQ2243147.1 IS3 family transposase [Bacteroidales bacterium]MBQ2243510.1 IS3 family transposase [Bacteroidales bacterium]MBQ2244102.1 IS3 family transposase [Bacteroidales bacterium]